MSWSIFEEKHHFRFVLLISSFCNVDLVIYYWRTKINVIFIYPFIALYLIEERNLIIADEFKAVFNIYNLFKTFVTCNANESVINPL